ncbi:MAG: hypothetical protein ABFD79_16585 [Phycisphaerales bacterium]
MRRREKQLKVITELFEENEGEQKVLKANNISEQTFRKWLTDKYFISTITNKIKTINLSNQILLAKLLPAVTAKLVHLCSSDNEDVSRKACLAFMELQKIKEPNPDVEEEPKLDFDDETASKVWAVIAESRKKKVKSE